MHVLVLVTDFSIDDVVSEKRHYIVNPTSGTCQQPSISFLLLSFTNNQLSRHLSILFISPSFLFLPQQISSASVSRRSFFRLISDCTETRVPHRCALSFNSVLRGFMRSGVESRDWLFLSFSFPTFPPYPRCRRRH